MMLKKIKIFNYRNLDDIEISFSDNICFLVGENNLGKSNVLRAINHIFNVRRFEEEDFYDSTKEIHFDFQLLLDDSEIGSFDDCCTPENPNEIDISLEQIDCDSPLTFTHIQSGVNIPNYIIKEYLVIDYDSIRNPKNEISFQKTRGAATLLNYMINKYVNENSDEYLNASKISKAEKFLNRNMEKVLPNEKFGIKTSTYSDKVELLSSIFTLVDENGIGISKIGYGIQYNILIVLSIFEKIIIHMKKNKNDIINAIFLIDEPEIHLHPYMQRSLVKYLQELCSGNDEGFKDILLRFFGIKSFNGQIIIATHSPNIINNDFKKICRFYKDNNCTKVVSSNNIVLDKSEEKQLYIQYHYIKEAMFARGALIVEGDSEYWSFYSFAKTLGFDFDQRGIILIHADGANSVIPLMKLFEKLAIKCVGIVDKDKKGSIVYNNVYYTTQLCFDSEVVAKLINEQRIDVLQKIINDNSTLKLKTIVQESALKKINEKYKLVDNSSIKSTKISSLINPSIKGLYFLTYVTWFSNNKGALLSDYLGKLLPKELIPNCYKKVIKKIISLV